MDKTGIMKIKGFRLPAAQKARGLTSKATAKKADAIGKSDGARSALDVFARASQEADEDAAEGTARAGRGMAGGGFDRRGVNRALVATSRQRVASDVRATTERALAQDPSIFDYDGAFDDIQAQRQRETNGCTLSGGGGGGVDSTGGAGAPPPRKKSRYIGTLLEKAKTREREDARVFERKLLRERAAEDAQFGDKERFVTSAYKRKLQEQQQWELEDARQAEREAREDVTKKDGMQGFYASMLTRNIAMGSDVAASATSAYTPGSGRAIDDSATASERATAAAVPASLDNPSPSAAAPAASALASTAEEPALGTDAWKAQRREQIARVAQQEQVQQRLEAEAAEQKQQADAEAAAARRAAAVSSARERYLERKRQRQQQQQ